MIFTFLLTFPTPLADHSYLLSARPHDATDASHRMALKLSILARQAYTTSHHTQSATLFPFSLFILSNSLSSCSHALLAVIYLFARLTSVLSSHYYAYFASPHRSSRHHQHAFNIGKGSCIPDTYSCFSYPSTQDLPCCIDTYIICYGFKLILGLFSSSVWSARAI